MFSAEIMEQPKVFLLFFVFSLKTIVVFVFFVFFYFFRTIRWIWAHIVSKKHKKNKYKNNNGFQ